MRNTLLYILIGIASNAWAQTDTLYVEEFDTIVVSKDPVIINSQHIEYFVPSVKKYSYLFYFSGGAVLNNTKMCDYYSKDSLKKAHQSAYFFSINALIQKKYKKRIGIEGGISFDYFNQKYMYPDSLLGQQTMTSTIVYLGLQSSVSYAIIESQKNFSMSYYIGLKGLFTMSQNGYMYNVADAYAPVTVASQNKSFAYGLISRLEATYKTGYNSSLVFGINYYFDLKPYTNTESNYYIHRNIPGLFLGYRFGFL